MIGGTLEGQNQRTLELIEHLLKTGQLTLHGLLYLLHDTQSTTELAKIAELSSKRPLTIQTSLADRDANTIANAIKECGDNGKAVRMDDGYYLSESFLWEYAQRIKDGV